MKISFKGLVLTTPLATMLAVGAAHGQMLPVSDTGTVPSWSGWWFGVQAGVGRNSVDASMGANQGFCVVTSSGSGASSECSIDAGSVYAETSAFVEGAEAISGGLAAYSGPGSYSRSAAAASAAFPAPASEANITIDPFGSTDPVFDSTSSAGATAGAGLPTGPLLNYSMTEARSVSSVNNGFAYAYSRSEATNSSETVSSSAFASSGLFDFGSLGQAHNSGAALGVHVHYDHALQNGYLFGAGLDISTMPGSSNIGSASDSPIETIAGSGGTGNLTASAGMSMDMKTNALGSLRLRAGRATGTVMSYMTLGLAYGEFEAELNKTAEVQFMSAPAQMFSSSQHATLSAVGAVVGGGVSFWLSHNTVASIEGLYYLFDDQVGFSTGESVSVENVAVISAKLSFKLN